MHCRCQKGILCVKELCQCRTEVLKVARGSRNCGLGPTKVAQTFGNCQNHEKRVTWLENASVANWLMKIGKYQLQEPRTSLQKEIVSKGTPLMLQEWTCAGGYVADTVVAAIKIQMQNAGFILTTISQWTWQLYNLDKFQGFFKPCLSNLLLTLFDCLFRFS